MPCPQAPGRSPWGRTEKLQTVRARICSGSTLSHLPAHRMTRARQTMELVAVSNTGPAGQRKGPALSTGVDYILFGIHRVPVHPPQGFLQNLKSNLGTCWRSHIWVLLYMNSKSYSIPCYSKPLPTKHGQLHYALFSRWNLGTPVVNKQGALADRLRGNSEQTSEGNNNRESGCHVLKIMIKIDSQDSFEPLITRSFKIIIFFQN